MQIGQTVCLQSIGKVAEVMLQGKAMPLNGPHVTSGTVVGLEPDTVIVDVPNGYKTPWRKPPAEVFETPEGAQAAVDAYRQRLTDSIEALRTPGF